MISRSILMMGVETAIRPSPGICKLSFPNCPKSRSNTHVPPPPRPPVRPPALPLNSLLIPLVRSVPLTCAAGFALLGVYCLVCGRGAHPRFSGVVLTPHEEVKLAAVAAAVQWICKDVEASVGPRTEATRYA